MADLVHVQFPFEGDAKDIDADANAVAADAGGDNFVNTPHVAFWAKNTSGGDIDVTFDAVTACNFGELHDDVVTVPDGFEGIIRHEFPANRFSTKTAPKGRVNVTYESVTNLKVAAVLFLQE